GLRCGIPGPRREERDRRGYVYRSRPQADDRYEDVDAVQRRPAPVERGEEHEERAPHRRPAIVLEAAPPPLRLRDAVAYESHEQRRRAPEGEQGAPVPPRADRVVGDGGVEDADV